MRTTPIFAQTHTSEQTISPTGLFYCVSLYCGSVGDHLVLLLLINLILFYFILFWFQTCQLICRIRANVFELGTCIMHRVYRRQFNSYRHRSIVGGSMFRCFQQLNILSLPRQARCQSAPRGHNCWPVSPENQLLARASAGFYLTTYWSDTSRLRANNMSINHSINQWATTVVYNCR